MSYETNFLSRCLLWKLGTREAAFYWISPPRSVLSTQTGMSFSGSYQAMFFHIPFHLRTFKQKWWGLHLGPSACQTCTFTPNIKHIQPQDRGRLDVPLWCDQFRNAVLDQSVLAAAVQHSFWFSPPDTGALISATATLMYRVFSVVFHFVQFSLCSDLPP